MDVYIIRSQSVPGAKLCPHAHFWMHCIYTPEGIKSVRSIREASYGLNSGMGSRRYPRSFLLCSKIKKRKNLLALGYQSDYFLLTDASKHG